MNYLTYSRAVVIGAISGMLVPSIYYIGNFLSLSNYVKINDFSPNDVCTIFQKQWGITNASSVKPILSTINVGPCVAVAIFSKNTSQPAFNKAALLHYDDNTKREDLEKILNNSIKIFGFDSNNLQVTLIGGWSHISESKKLANFINNFFIDINIKPNIDKLLSGVSFSTVGIDARTGNILLLDKTLNEATEQEKNGIIVLLMVLSHLQLRCKNF